MGSRNGLVHLQRLGLRESQEHDWTAKNTVIRVRTETKRIFFLNNRVPTISNNR